MFIHTLSLRGVLWLFVLMVTMDPSSVLTIVSEYQQAALVRVSWRTQMRYHPGYRDDETDVDGAQVSTRSVYTDYTHSRDNRERSWRCKRISASSQAKGGADGDRGIFHNTGATTSKDLFSLRIEPMIDLRGLRVLWGCYRVIWPRCTIHVMNHTKVMGRLIMLQQPLKQDATSPFVMRPHTPLALLAPLTRV